ncbi:hypothetical protein A5893_02755 [Pedobacter psychrophilus]|uniref:Glycosyl transferase family 1 domain-containing protein n=1 Tax=Pedobacter psychrophilus TaxID=1826909 RepID=A0A179DMN7_9SPHI|nr:glycosyltransferase family 4 protein [Pedobacter psychrophilus]OAQ42052.1 hypothetical protein A5893_02755 [Pedobacter psychrophilus]
MLQVNYITRPWFFDISVEFIRELKQRVNLNVILIIAPATASYLGLSDQEAKRYLNKTLKLEDVLKGENYQRLYPYFEGANVLCKFEEHNESSIKNAFGWSKLLFSNKNIYKADYTIIESLSFADWYFLFRIRNKKLFYIIHDPVAHTGEERGRIDTLNKLYFPYIDKFITYSHFSAKIFSQNFPLYKEKLEIFKMPIYTSLNIGKQKAYEVKKRKKVVFFGRISPYKGAELFYDAAIQLAIDYVDTDFIIAGKAIEGYNPDFLNYNPYQNIIIKNRFIDLEELHEIMSDADLCVLPYLDATQSGVIMTAYAFGLPVLVSDCEGLLEYCFDKENFSFSNGDIDDLRNKMEILISSPDLLALNKQQILAYSKQNVSAKNVDLTIS